MNQKSKPKELIDFNSNLIYYYQGEPLLEFCIAAIPCYLFLIAFIIRYMAIKDLGIPKRLSFGYLLIFKLILTMGIMLVRFIQIFSAFDNPDYWLYKKPYYALLYTQFIIAHGLSFHLLILQHLKRLPEVCYCQNLFWGLSFFCSIIFIKLQADQLSLMYDVALISLQGILFIVGFFKRKTYIDFQHSSRPLIREDEWAMSNIGYSELSILSKKTGTIAKINDKQIDFKFRSKLVSYQGTIFFEFRVILPRHIYMGSNELQNALDTDYLGKLKTFIIIQSSNLCFKLNGQYILKKSLQDFFALTSHINSRYSLDAPKFDQQIFRNRLRGDQTKIMNKSIKIFENYLKKLGKHQLFWDDQFMRFLKINDPIILQRLSGEQSYKRVKEEEYPSMQDQVSRLYQTISVIDNYDGDKSKPEDKVVIQTQNELFTIAHRNTFSQISIEMLDSDYDKVKFRVSLQDSQGWVVVKRKDQLNEIFRMVDGSQNLEQFLHTINEKGPSIEVLFFIDYFAQMNKSQNQYTNHMLQTNGYKVQSVNILSSRIEIDEFGKSIQRLELVFNILILSVQRLEILYLTKTFKEVKKFVKQIRQDLNLDEGEMDFPIRGQSFVRTIQDQSKVVTYLTELYNFQEVRQTDQAIQFLSDVQNQYTKNTFRHTNTARGGLHGQTYSILGASNGQLDPIQNYRMSDYGDVSNSIQGFVMSREDSDLLGDGQYDMMYYDYMNENSISVSDDDRGSQDQNFIKKAYNPQFNLYIEEN